MNTIAKTNIVYKLKYNITLFFRGVRLGLFNRETPEHKEKRLAHEKKCKEIYETEKRKEQLAEAGRAGKIAGAKGKRTLTDKLGDMGRSLGKSVTIMESALGGVPKQKSKPKNQPNDNEPIIIYLNKKNKQPPKKKSVMDQLFGEP